MYRLYVDEVGNHHMSNLKTVQDPNHRYLSLTGVMMDKGHARDVLAPRLEALKCRHFPGHHPDEPIVLHRKEIVQGARPFQALRDPAARAAFDDDLFELLDEAEYTVVTVVVDKIGHHQRYTTAHHPYHHCMGMLLERYVQWLEGRGVGDVMVEGRGTREDASLFAAVAKVVERGTSYVSASRMRSALLDALPRKATKAQNIAGLQVADILAHPSFTAMKLRKIGGTMRPGFGVRVAKLLELKKYRRDGARVEGFGRKWLP